MDELPSWSPSVSGYGLEGAILAEPLELVEGDAELAHDLEDERWPDFTSAVQRNRDRTAVVMVPTFVAARLTCPRETELQSHSLHRGQSR